MPQDGSIGPNPSVASFRNLSLIILFELIPDLDFNKFMSVECYIFKEFTVNILLFQMGEKAIIEVTLLVQFQRKSREAEIRFRATAAQLQV